MWSLDFYKGKKVLITGHTGFKGSWMCEILLKAGAFVTGYALEPLKKENLFCILDLESRMNSVIGDVRDLRRLQQVFQETEPEIVFHLAAQPLVRESYKNPVYTYEVNVMGTVNLLECIRQTKSVKSLVNVTTDKVYENKEWCWGYREDDILKGYDPYSNSKSCSELVTYSYKNSFFSNAECAISTARAGNVIGGGDFAADRIIPDCVRAACKQEKIVVRNPYSIRPFQHVLEPVMAYLMIAQEQYQDKQLASSYNVGPEEKDCITTGKLVDLFCEKWGDSLQWVNVHDGGPHEAGFLKLDCAKIKQILSWKPVWGIEKAVEETVRWTKAWQRGEDVKAVMKEQIENYYLQMKGER